MPLEIKKQGKESPQSLARQFIKRVKQSGILKTAREISFRTRKKSENMKKRSALRKEEIKKEYIIKEKMGKF